MKCMLDTFARLTKSASSNDADNIDVKLLESDQTQIFGTMGKINPQINSQALWVL